MSESSMSMILQGATVTVASFPAIVEEFDSNTQTYILTVLSSGQKAVVPVEFVREQGAKPETVEEPLVEEAE